MNPIKIHLFIGFSMNVQIESYCYVGLVVTLFTMDCSHVFVLLVAHPALFVGAVGKLRSAIFILYINKLKQIDMLGACLKLVTIPSE